MFGFHQQRPTRLLLFALVLLLLGQTISSRGRCGQADLTTVLFDKSCPSQVLEIEIWNRTTNRWQLHPEHPRILSGSCQLEDAGYLMNEIRVRCLRMEGQPIEPWTDGIKVYDPGIVDACELPRSRAPIVVVESPGSGEIIRNETRLVRVEGRTIFTEIERPAPRSYAAAQLIREQTGERPRVHTVQVENLSTETDALDLVFDPNGQFSAVLSLRTGNNFIQITVTDENDQQGDVTLPVVFDISMLREKALKAERERIERFRAKQLEGQVDVDVVDP